MSGTDPEEVGNGAKESFKLKNKPPQTKVIRGQGDVEHSGITLGLLLKDYMEFKGVSSMLYNIFLLAIIFSVIEYNYDGSQSSTLKNKAIQQFTNHPNGHETVYEMTSVHSACMFYAERLKELVDDQIASTDRTKDNDINLGRYGYVRAAYVTFSPVAHDSTNQKSLINCNMGTPEEDRDCTSFANVMSNENTKMYSVVHETYNGPKPWAPFNADYFKDPKYFTEYTGHEYTATLFDSRNSTWTLQNTADTLDEFVNVFLPSIGPYQNWMSIRLLIEDYWTPPRSRRINGGEADQGGAYQWLFLDAMVNDIYSSFNPLYPRSVRVEMTSMGQFVGRPYQSSIRLLLDLIMLALTLSQFISEWNDRRLSHMQDPGGTKYWRSHWNRLDLFCLTITLVFLVAKLFVQGVLYQSVLSMSRDPFARENLYPNGIIADACAATWKAVYKNMLDAASIFVVCVFCLRLFKYFRFHSALRLYIRFMEILATQVEGFIIIFLGLIFMFARIFLAFAKYSGSTDSWPSTAFSINEMLKVTFGFSDYDGFVNNGSGFGFLAGLSILAFWISVIVFTILAQNIILALIGSAQESARRPDGVSGSLLGYLVRIVVFNASLLVTFGLCLMVNALPPAVSGKGKASPHALYKATVAVAAAEEDGHGHGGKGNASVAGKEDELGPTSGGPSSTSAFCSSFLSQVESWIHQSYCDALSSMKAGYNLAITTGNNKRSLEEIWCELLTHEAVLERLTAVYLCTVNDTASIHQIGRINLVPKTRVTVNASMCSQVRGVTYTGLDINSNADANQLFLEALVECEGEGEVVSCESKVRSNELLPSGKNSIWQQLWPWSVQAPPFYYADVLIEFQFGDSITVTDAIVTAGSYDVTVSPAEATAIHVGDSVSGPGVSLPTTVVSVTGNSVNLSECVFIGLVSAGTMRKISLTFSSKTEKKIRPRFCFRVEPEYAKYLMALDKKETNKEGTVQCWPNDNHPSLDILNDTTNVLFKACSQKGAHADRIAVFGNIPTAALDMFNVVLSQSELQNIIGFVAGKEISGEDNHASASTTATITAATSTTSSPQTATSSFSIASYLPWQQPQKFSALEKSELLSATEDLFAAYQHSVLHHHSVLLARLDADSNRSVFETTDDKIEDALNISLAFAGGGFKKGVTKQISAVNSNVDDLRKILIEKGVKVIPKDMENSLKPTKDGRRYNVVNSFRPQVGGDKAGMLQSGGGGGGQSNDSEALLADFENSLQNADSAQRAALASKLDGVLARLRGSP